MSQSCSCGINSFFQSLLLPHGFGQCFFAYNIGIIMLINNCKLSDAVVDPEFRVGGRRPVRGRGPPTRALFGEIVCKIENNWAPQGACTGHAP